MENVSGSLVMVPLPAISISFTSTMNDDNDSLGFLKTAAVQTSAYLNDFFAIYYNSTLHNIRNYGFSQVDIFMNSDGIRSEEEDGEDGDEDDNDDDDDSGRVQYYYATVNIGGSALYYEKGEKESHVQSIVKAALEKNEEDSQQQQIRTPKSFWEYLTTQSDDYFLQGLVVMEVHVFDYSSMPQQNHGSSLLKSVAIGTALILGVVFLLAAAIIIGVLCCRRYWMGRRRQTKHHDKSTNADRKEGLIPSQQANGDARSFA